MLEAINRLYFKTRNKEIVKNAVARNWITKDDYFTVVGENFENGVVA